MSLYASVDDSCFVDTYRSLAEIVKACENHYTVSGKTITKSIAKKELKSGFMSVYRYNEDQLQEACKNGNVHGVNWVLRFQLIRK